MDVLEWHRGRVAALVDDVRRRRDALVEQGLLLKWVDRDGQVKYRAAAGGRKKGEKGRVRS